MNLKRSGIYNSLIFPPFETFFLLPKVSSGRTPRATEPHQLLQRPEGFPDPVAILALLKQQGEWR